MYSAWLGQSSGATIRNSVRPASSAAVETRTAPSRCECSSAFFQARKRDIRRPSGGCVATSPSPGTERSSSSLCQGVDVRQLAIQPGVVETVADHETVGDHKSREVDLDRHLAACRAVAQAL